MTRGAPLTLDAIYAVPNPFDSCEQWERYQHGDLSRLTRAELEVERARCRLRVLLDGAPDPWLFERLRRLGEVGDRAR
jgi:hypothetical protein